MYNKNKTPRERVMEALRGGCSDKVPFTVYENMIPQCSTERELRNKGLCIVYRKPSYNILHPNVDIKTYGYTNEEGEKFVRTIYNTPHGELSTLQQAGINTSWTLEHMFKSPEDYKALRFFIEDSVIVPNYASVVKLEKQLGEDFVLRDKICLEPLQQLISKYMGTETFCFEWMDNRDEIMKFYNSSVNIARKIYSVVADGPLEFANYGGNVVPQIIGVDNFEKYYVPHYNEAAEILHKKGKVIGCHFDADNTTIMKSIAKTELDYIEAYDAGISPSVKEARKAWPNKVLWLNWPSTWQLYSQEDIYNSTLKLIEEAGSKNGFIIGITEDVPEERWQQNFTTIMDAINKA
ncbi:hypothetical protein SH2C18_24070 [Clostridium sediminicola]|uniref:uroporphyrinogen decarboxylase family protein n=1 Tax=Clostridium sediminicola TaxID=3114879 RepID=UPI0031F1D96E